MMWYWGSSDINEEFLSPRDKCKKEGKIRLEVCCIDQQLNNYGTYNIYDWQDLLEAGFLLPVNTTDYLDTTLKYPEYCLLLRQFSHSIVEFSKGNFQLKQPYDCREVTTDMQVALFFACKTKKHREKDGKVVVFQPFEGEYEGIKCLDSANLEYKYSGDYPDCNYYLRAKRQAAVLLHNTRGTDGTVASMNKRILLQAIIPAASKQKILDYLSSEGINFNYLFPSLRAYRRENATASGTMSEYFWDELNNIEKTIEEYHRQKGDVNWIYDEDF